MCLPSKMFLFQFLEIMTMLSSMVKGTLTNVIKFETLKWEIGVGYVGGPNRITRVFIKGKQENQSHREKVML